LLSKKIAIIAIWHTQLDVETPRGLVDLIGAKPRTEIVIGADRPIRSNSRMFVIYEPSDCLLFFIHQSSFFSVIKSRDT
jgi:hypothetical protein